MIKVGGVEQLITSQGEAVIAYSPADGKELWRCRHGGHSVVPRPVAGNGLVYFCTGYWTPALMAVRPDGHGDVTDSHVEFTVRRSVPHNPSPLLVKDRLYMVSDLGVLTCVDAIEGTEIWRQRLAGSFSASPTLADGKIYLVNENGSDATSSRRATSSSCSPKTTWTAARWRRRRSSGARFSCAPIRTCIASKSPRMYGPAQRHGPRDRLSDNSLPRDPAVNVNVAATLLDARRRKAQSMRHQFGAGAAHRTDRAGAPDQLGSDEHMDLVDLADIEQAAQHLSAAFNQNVGHLPPSQFVQ